jgi:DNA-binding response OmpR family regulator
VLLLEDETGIANTIRSGLPGDQFHIRHAPTVSEARRLIEAYNYDAAVLDLGLPDGHGFEIAEALRASNDTIGILILSVQGSVDQKIEGFCRGADDYLTKPFTTEELSARLQAIVRRSRAFRSHQLSFADFEVDLLRRRLRRGDTEATLSSRELDLLVYFVNHANVTLERDRILKEVWGDEAEEDSNVVNVYVNYLRNKLEQGTHGRLIHTVRGIGYRFSHEHFQPERG